MEGPLNLFFKSLPLLLVFLALPSLAINVKSIYVSACKREVGVIVDVDDHNLKILSVDGDVKKIPRHNVIFLADYPMDKFPVKKQG